MSFRSLLSALPWLIVGTIPARADSLAAVPAASGLPGSSGIGKLVPGTVFDGEAFLGLDYRDSEAGGGGGSRGGLIARWNPDFLGWEARLASGTVIWQALGNSGPSSGPHTRLTKTELFLDEAWVRYPFASARWHAAVQAGMFRWRSHRDAALAGEYLARWGAYPAAVLRPGMGYESPDSLTTVLTGLRAALATPGRSFSQELLAVLDERYDEMFLTVIGTAAVAPWPGFEAGIGAAFHEPLRPRKANSGSSTYRARYVGPDGMVDTVLTTDGFPSSRVSLEYRTQVYSARLSLDLAAWIAGASRRDRGGRLYAEAAVLGWEDYPFLYTDRMRRVQFCAGLNLPAFGLLDVLRFQAEHRALAAVDNPYFRFSDSPRPSLWPGDPEPASGWIGQLYLARALLPWLELQGMVLREPVWTWTYPQVYGAAIPVRQPEASPQPAQPTPPAEEAWWSFAARISARL